MVGEDCTSEGLLDTLENDLSRRGVVGNASVFALNEGRASALGLIGESSGIKSPISMSSKSDIRGLSG